MKTRILLIVFGLMMTAAVSQTARAQPQLMVIPVTTCGQTLNTPTSSRANGSSMF